MVLGKLPVPGRPTFRIIVGQGPIALAVGAGGGCFDKSFLSSFFTGRRLASCFGLNGPLRQYFSLYWAVFQREGERKK